MENHHVKNFFPKKVSLKEQHCWFASDVTAAMLVVKNKNISLRWEMNSILMQI